MVSNLCDEQEFLFPKSRTRIFQLRLFHLTQLEVDLLQPGLSGFVEAKTDGDVMGIHIHCSDVRYAVIQASSKKERPERLVIAYHDENCLRGLIAAPSIIGLGFASREEAIAKPEGRVSDGAPSKQLSGHRLVKHCRIPQSILQFAVAAFIALFYSKNIVSVMIRMALGASF
jgi:hypothetical protein